MTTDPLTDQPPATVASALARAGRADYLRWEAMVRASGWCSQPVRLTGRVLATDPATGQVAMHYSTTGEVDRVLLKSCGTRRATRCAACASVYRSDAKALLRLGLLDADDVASTSGGMEATPLVFVTLTAPSFGAVHRSSGAGRCRPGTAGRLECIHRVRRWCEAVHAPGDQVIGEALCPGCYDYDGAVVFNARAGELWRRTVIATQRRLAAALGVTVRRFAEQWRLSFAKVVEFQARGVVHIHGLVRLDARSGAGHGLDGTALAEAFLGAAGQVTLSHPLQGRAALRWGAQSDAAVIPPRRRRAAAAYLAKYSTKSVDGAGSLDRRMHSSDVSRLDLPPQLARMASTAWDLGERPELAELRLRTWAHSLGYRGHWLTKSRGWSTTFGELRARRQRWRLARLGYTDEQLANRWGEWTFVGMGHATPGDVWLAASANAARRQSRRTAWEER